MKKIREEMKKDVKARLEDDVCLTDAILDSHDIHNSKDYRKRPTIFP